MAIYTVEARPRVRNALRQLDPATRKEILSAMRALEARPRPTGAKSLKGHRPWLGVRVGDYRIIYWGSRYSLGWCVGLHGIVDSAMGRLPGPRGCGGWRARPGIWTVPGWLAAVVAPGPWPVLALDLTDVRFIDCAGVGALLANCRAAREDGGRLIVVALSPCARRVIGLTGLQAVLGSVTS
jgi:mRNA-degrading endonuclease RelE of RelBE toxin-antitoxin system/ABC-type transporter Mla MlaB component